MIAPGRNDPCHCGSGKKYKKCHLDADQRTRAGICQSQPNSESEPALPAVEDLPKLLQQLSDQGSAKDRKRFAELLSKTEPILEYVKRRPQIEAAAAKLETHRSEFEKLAADEDRYLALAQTVFEEECFAPLRFTASDVQRAFDHVGYPATMSPDERTAEILRAAILRVADEERRSRLAASLLLHLPDFVAAGRHLEAWLLQCSAIETAENQSESNPFLFEMFSYGYDAWAADDWAKDQSLLRTLGLDPEKVPTMSVEELDSWIQIHSSDPTKAATLEAFFQRNPHLRDESVANLEALHRNCVNLLDREDARSLHLSTEEIHPWLTLLEERAYQQRFLSDTPGGPASEENVRKVFEELALPLMREMADSIFTRDRIQKLVANLTEYRRKRFAAGDKTTAGLAMGAINYLQNEDSPRENSFLLTLCWVSLTSAIKPTVAETGHPLDLKS